MVQVTFGPYAGRTGVVSARRLVRVTRGGSDVPGALTAPLVDGNGVLVLDATDDATAAPLNAAWEIGVLFDVGPSRAPKVVLLPAAVPVVDFDELLPAEGLPVPTYPTRGLPGATGQPGAILLPLGGSVPAGTPAGTAIYRRTT